MNKVVDTKASRETAPPPSNGLETNQSNASNSEALATDSATEPGTKRDPVEEIQDQAHPFN